MRIGEVADAVGVNPKTVAFGRSDEFDLLGTTKAYVDRPFIDAMRTAMAAAPQLQGAIDGLTGRVVRLTAEGARLLRDNESMRTTVLTGVVRSPETGKIAGHLTFINSQSLASMASTLPSIAGGAAMQLQLARIEKALDGLKQDLGYLIRNEHLKIEAGTETNLEILQDVYAISRRRGRVEDDQWDRIANIEASVRSLHKESKKHLRSLEEALDSESQGLTARVARLNRALDDERTLFWLRLDELLRVFPRMTELDGHADPIPLGDGSAERKQWDRLVSGARSLPQAAVPVLKTIGDRLPRLLIRRAKPDEDDQ